jgi:small-conductance mechanosensitive channel
MTEFLQSEVWGNEVQTYLKALIILIIGAAGVTLIRYLLPKLFTAARKPVRGTEQEQEQAPVASGMEQWFRRAVVPLLYMGVLYLALTSLSLGARVEALLRGAVTVVVTVVVVRSLIIAADKLLQRFSAATADAEQQRRLKPLRSIIGIILWTIGFVFLLDNLGFNISAVVAGLGVSGIAVAIAAQGILGDLFNYLVILFDKPFETGDFIIFDDKLGMVEKIGIKTTRVRSLTGEELVVSNSGLAGARLHNYGRMQSRRVVFQFGVTYNTRPPLLREIPRIVRESVEAQENARFDRSHFKSYGDFALVFENVYYVLTPDYAVYMDIQQDINLRIYEAFEELGISFAYPTQTVYLRHDSGDSSAGLPSSEPSAGET